MGVFSLFEGAMVILFTSKSFWCLILVQVLLFFYARRQKFTDLFTEEDKKTLFSKLPMEGSQCQTDYGSLRGNKVRMAMSTVEGIGRLDLIVVGSGLGGLTVASIMAQAGYKVLVLEQHGTAGGNTATIEEKGYEFDTFHTVGGSVGRLTSPLRKMMDIVTGGFVEWCQVQGAVDIITVCKEGGSDVKVEEEYVVYSNIEKTKRELKKKFPKKKDTEAIDKFYNHVYLTKFFMAPWFLIKVLLGAGKRRWLFNSFLCKPLKDLAEMTTREKLKKWTDNEELIGVLSYMSASKCQKPDEVSFLTTAMETDHLQDGAWYPKGGPCAISMSACEVIRRNGGQVLTQSKVERFLFDDDTDMGKHATKVRSGRCWGVVVNGHSVYALRVVSDAGVRSTLLELLPKRYQENLYDGFLLKLKHFAGISAGTESSVLSSSVDGSFDVSSDGGDGGDGGDGVDRNVEKGSKLKIKKFGVAPSWSTVSLLVGFTASNDKVGLPPSNRYVYPSLDHSKNITGYSNKFTRPIPCVFMCSSSAKDTTWDSRWPKRTVLTVQCPVRYEWFAEWQGVKNRSTNLEYIKFCEFWTERLIKIVDKVYPQLKGKYHTKILKTPLDVNKRFDLKLGESHGVEETVSKNFTYCAEFSAATDITGLYLTGKDLCGGVGAVGGLWGGMICIFSLSKNRMIEYVNSCW